MNEKPSIAILGPGAVGGFMAAAFCQTGFPVVCIAKENTVDLIRRDGIYVDSTEHGEWHVFPEAAPMLEKPVDVLFITTKAIHLQDAIQRLRPEHLSRTVIVPLLNGIEHMDLLRERFGNRLVGASVRIEAKYLSPNHFAHTSPFAFVHWASDDIPAERLNALGSVLAQSGIGFKPGESEKLVLFDKLIRLNALACTTAAFNQPIGVIRSEPAYQPYLEGCLREGVALAKAEGLDYEVSDILAFIDKLPEALGTSLQRDLHAGKEIELDAIAGAVVRRAHRHGLSCPTIEELMTRIRHIQARPVSV